MHLHCSTAIALFPVQLQGINAWWKNKQQKKKTWEISKTHWRLPALCWTWDENSFWDISLRLGKLTVVPQKYWGKSSFQLSSAQRFLMVFVKITIWGVHSCDNHFFSHVGNSQLVEEQVWAFSSLLSRQNCGNGRCIKQWIMCWCYHGFASLQ